MREAGLNHEANSPAPEGPITSRRAYYGMIGIRTKHDAIRHIAIRTAVAVSSTAITALVILIVRFGLDLNAQVSLFAVATTTVLSGVFIAAVLTSFLTYRSTVVLRKLNEMRCELLRISRTDPLTGLLNRRGYEEEALMILGAAGRRKNLAVVLMIDIDHFKAINDAYGHEFGDEVLAEVGKVIQVFGQEHGILTARHGGEEFTVLMVGISELHGGRLAEALRLRCAAATIARGRKIVSVTVSIGLAASRQTKTLPAIVRAADAALYSAKRRGRNCVARSGDLAVLTVVA